MLENEMLGLDFDEGPLFVFASPQRPSINPDT